jgi:hypothetical protein
MILVSPVNLRSRALASGAFFRIGQALSYILVAKSSTWADSRLLQIARLFSVKKNYLHWTHSRTPL